MSDPITATTGIWITLKSNLASLVAGVLGAAVSLKFASPNLANWEKVTTVLSGALLAHFLSPLVAAYLELGTYVETVGFLIGLFGLSLCAAILEIIKKTDITSIIKGRFGG